MVKKTYIIQNLGCANCAAKMEAKIQTLPQVKEARITFATRQLMVEAKDPDALLPQMQKIVSSIETDARISRQDHHDHGEHCTCGHDHHHHGHQEKRELPGLLIGAGLFAAGLILPGLWGKLAFLAAWLVLGANVLLTAGKNILKGQVFDENFLMSIATIGAFLIGEFPEAAGVMLFYRVGEYFEHRAVEHSRKRIMAAVDLRPETVNRIHGDHTEVIPAGDAQVGDRLLVRPGDRIPLDGLVLSGESRVDTAPITGEPVPVSVRPGDRVVSGCVNGEAQLIVQVEKPLSESMVTRILQAVENAAAGKPKIDRFITRFARIYTPIVVAAAAVTAIVPSLITGHWNYWIYTALSFLVMSCPCALVLSVPLAFFSGIGVGSRKGILFKGGASIEALAGIRAAAVDKTGTVTKGDFRVQKWEGREDVLALCAACEQNSTHPIAVSITAEAKSQNLPLAAPQELQEISGHGIRAILNGKTILCGNEKLMKRFSVRYPQLRETGTVVMLAEDGNYIGHLVISDTLKDGAAEAMGQLKAMGIHTAMLTGDSVQRAEEVAREAGIEAVYGGLLPQNKLTHLQELREKFGPCMFVGDGINDAPVLAGADVGAAMGSGADAAIEAADVVFMTSDVAAIPASVAIARRTRRTAWQNVVFALAVKAVVMVLGLLGYASLWMAVFADSGVAMLCVLNSIRLLCKKR